MSDLKDAEEELQPIIKRKISASASLQKVIDFMDSELKQAGDQAGRSLQERIGSNFKNNLQSLMGNGKIPRNTKKIGL